MKIALLTTDTREVLKDHGTPTPHFGTAPKALMQGFARLPELKNLLRGAAALVLPSLEDNCPMTVLEAMAAGVPVVAAKVCRRPDLIEEGKTRFCCDPQEAVSMPAAVKEVLGQSLIALLNILAAQQ